MAAAAAAAPVYDAAFFDNMRVGETSRKNYTRDIKDLKDWLKANGHGDCLIPNGDADGEIDVARFTADVKVFKDWILSHKAKGGGIKRKWSYAPLRSV